MQYKKAYSPIVVTELGMVTSVRPLQPLKAFSPMLVTDEPKITEVKPVHPWKAKVPIVSTSSPIIISFIEFKLSNHQSPISLLWTTTEVRPLHQKYLQIALYQRFTS